MNAARSSGTLRPMTYASLRRRSARLALAALLLLGCGDDTSSADDAGAPDAAVDGGADAGVDAGFDAGLIVDREVGLSARPSNTSCVAPEPPPASSYALRVEPAFSALETSQPIQLLQRDGRFYIVERPGRVLTFTSVDGSGATVLLDISERVSTSGEGGLLAMALHPDFASNGELFLSYTTDAGGFRSRISRFRASSAADVPADSEEILLELAQPYTNHNGGWIGFDPTSSSGELYIGFGDGGSGGDPLGSGQDTTTLLGAVLRIDVDGGEPYGIPTDNPFAAGGRFPGEGALEIYAWGVRNPWRMSFDRATGELWAGDVGQNIVEEIDLIESGGNYGWNVREGDRCYEAASCAEDFVEPAAVYLRDDGASVTGGFVYRGAAIPALAGVYLYADFSSGRLFGLVPDPESGDPVHTRLLETGLNPAGFGAYESGELSLLDLGAGIYRLATDSDPSPSTFPNQLSETGCMDASDPSLPGPGLIPFAPQATLWSDGATKERWLALPEGAQITVDDEGDFVFPIGTVLIKQFRLAGRLLETRLYLRHPSGTWGGYTYVWDETGTDATLELAGTRIELGDSAWLVPSQAQCQQCHSAAAGRSLGLELAQLNGDFVYPEDADGLRPRANQLRTLVAMGALELADDPAELDALPLYDDESAPIEARARGYLHINCSGCHRPSGPGRGGLDLRYFASPADLGCDRVPQLGAFGVDEARVFAPGDAARSIASVRMHALDSGRMPPVGSEALDVEGSALVDAWIDALSSCE